MKESTQEQNFNTWCKCLTFQERKRSKVHSKNNNDDENEATKKCWKIENRTQQIEKDEREENIAKCETQWNATK